MSKRAGFFRFVFAVEPMRPGAEFPVDMLRYDSCWPITEGRDSAAIARSFRHDGDAGPVKLFACSARSDWQPSAERWKSFGWAVKGMAVAS